MREVAVTERLAAVQPAVGDKVGRPDAQQVARAQVLVVHDTEVLDRGVVVLLRVVERLAVERIVAPCADGVSSHEHVVVDVHVIGFLLLLVGVRRAPRNQRDGLAAARVDITVAHLHVAHRAVPVVVAPPPDASARIGVAAGHYDAVVVRLEEDAGHLHVVRADAQADAVAADAFHLVHLHVAYEQVLAIVERRVVVVGADDLDVAQLDVAHFPESDRDHVDTVRADAGVVVEPRIDAVRVERADFALSGDLDVLDVLALDQRQVHVQAVRPRNARYHDVVAVGRSVGVVAFVLRLPQDRALFDVQVDVAAHHQMRGNVAPFVQGTAVSGQHDPAATSRRNVVDGRLNAPRVVGERIAFRAVVQHADAQSGQLERIGVVREIAPVLDVEVGRDFQVIVRPVQRDGQQPAAQVRHFLVPFRRNVVDDELPVERTLVELFQFFDTPVAFVHRRFIDGDAGVFRCVFGRNRAPDFDPLGRSRTAVDAACERFQDGFLLERNAVDRQFARTSERFDAETGQRAFGLRQIGKIEEISLFGRVRVDIENFRFFVVIDGVFRRDEANAEPVGRTAVLHDEEHRVAVLELRIADAVAASGERRRTERTSLVERELQRSVALRNGAPFSREQLGRTFEPERQVDRFAGLESVQLVECVFPYRVAGVAERELDPVDPVCERALAQIEDSHVPLLGRHFGHAFEFPSAAADRQPDVVVGPGSSAFGIDCERHERRIAQVESFGIFPEDRSPAVGGHVGTAHLQTVRSFVQASRPGRCRGDQLERVGVLAADESVSAVVESGQRARLGQRAFFGAVVRRGSGLFLGPAGRQDGESRYGEGGGAPRSGGESHG